MTKIISSVTLLLLVTLPSIVSAQGSDSGTGESGLLRDNGGAIGTSFSNVINFIDTAVIPFILAIGFLVFVWGVFQFFILGGANEEAKESGKSLIMYAIAGFVIILAFWGIVNIISSGLNLEGGNQEIDSPNSKVQPG